MRRFYLETIRGHRKGVAPFLLRSLLAATVPLYRFSISLRRLLYRIGILPSVRLPVPVISVGNLTAGGTGKTPFVEHLARRFSRQGLRTLILARGYGRMKDGGRDDEDLVSEMEIEGVVRIVGPNRVAGARRALAGGLRPDVILLDDGFQHLRIRRDLDLLVIDAIQPFAGGRLIPRGLLREPVTAARRADLLVLSRIDQVTHEERLALREFLEHVVPGKPVVETVHRPTQIRLLRERRSLGLDWLRGRPITAFCGIGNPEGFRRTLLSLGTDLLHFHAFPDHHPYAGNEARTMTATAQEFMTEALVTTEKDARKLRPSQFEIPLAVLGVELEIQKGEEHLEHRLRPLFQQGSRLPGAATSHG